MAQEEIQYVVQSPSIMSALSFKCAQTSVALSNFVLAMILHPDVMRKAQAEVDEVVGRDRPPTFTDIGELPYVCAVIRETLRWRPVAPVGEPL